MTGSKAMVLGASLFGAASGKDYLPLDTPLEYNMLKTQGITKYFNYTDSLNASGDLIVTVDKELPATLLDINMTGVDEYCPDTRMSSALPPNGCSIYVAKGNCTSWRETAYFFYGQTQINPWRKANYGYKGDDKTKVETKVLAGTGFKQEELEGTVVVAHDSAGQAFACGPVVGTQVQLAAVEGYTGNVQFQSGTVTVTTEMRKVARLVTPKERMRGLDENCVPDFENTDNQLRPVGGSVPNACGISILEGKSCDAEPNPHYWDHAPGQANPWLEVRYEVMLNGDAEPKPTQPVFAGLTLGDFAGRALMLYDSSGARIACSTLMPWGDAPTSTTMTTTAAPASSSLPTWGIVLIALGALALIGGLAALALCGGQKKRSTKKKSSKKRAYPVEEPAPLLSQPEPQPSVQPQQTYATPVYTTVHHVVPTASMYAAPVATAAPVTYAAPTHYAQAPIPTYAQPVATYAQHAIPYAQQGIATYAPGAGSVIMPQ